MAKFATLSLLACVLALCASSATAACAGKLVTTGCPCSTGPVGARCTGGLLCLPVDVLGLVKKEVCVLPNIVPTLCAVTSGLPLPLPLSIGCKCKAGDTLLSGTCIIPTVTGVVDSLGLPLVGDLTGLVNGLLGTVLGTVGQVLPVLPVVGQVVPLVTGTVCDLTKTVGIPYGCPCSAAKPCMAGAVCKKSIVNSVLSIAMVQSICLPL